MAQQQRAGEDGAQRVGDVAPGDVRRGAVNRLVQAARAAAQARGGHHAEAARDGGALVGEDVAEEVAGDHHVELGRAQDELHGGVVDVHVADLDLRILGGKALHGLAPEAGALEHVRLVDGAELAAALFGHLKADAREALDLHLGIGHLVGGGLAVVGAPALAEVDVAGQLAQDHDVDGLLDDVRAQRARAGKLRMDGAGAQVGEHAHALAQGEQALFGAAGRLDAIPLGAADAAHEHGVGRVAGGEGLVGEGHAERVDGRAAELALIEGEAVTVDGGDLFKDLDRLRDDLRADVIARKGDDMGVHGNDLHGNRNFAASSAIPKRCGTV